MMFGGPIDGITLQSGLLWHPRRLCGLLCLSGRYMKGMLEGSIHHLGGTKLALFIF